MTTIVGRDAELHRIDALLASSLKTRAARAMRIVGPSGVGKTALLDAALERARGQKWLIARVHGHQIQSSLPYFAARRLMRSLIETLSEEAERYSSGLDLDNPDAAVFEEAFYRVLEGLSLDHSVLVAVDEAQWADPESLTLIERSIRALGDRRITLLSAERAADSGPVGFNFRDDAIVLDDLPDAVCAAIATSIYPAAPAEVVDAIVGRASGRAVDVVALAEAANDQRAQSAHDVDINLRKTVSRDLALVDGATREFLQICSLIADPIHFSLLNTLWPEERVLECIARSGRFFVQREEGLYFVHDAIKQSVRETIAISIPLHRRIIAALQEDASPSFEDLELIVQHAAACGDRILQRTTLMTLADTALKGSIFSLAASAIERAIAIGQPPIDELIPLYARLSMLYNMLSREQDNVRICRFALEAAREAGITAGLAQLVVSLSIAEAHSGNRRGARDDLARYAPMLTTAADRAQLYSSELYLALLGGDADQIQAARSNLQTVRDQAEPIVQVRVNIYEAFIASRNGDVEQTISQIREAEEHTRSIPMARVMPLVASSQHAFMYHGPHGVEAQLASRRRDDHGIDVLDQLRLLSHIARGELNDALTLGSELTVRQRGILFRRLVLGLRASAAAFHAPDSDDAVWREVIGDVAAFQTGDESANLLPIVTAWLLHDSATNARRAKALLDRIVAASAHVGEPMVFHFPVLLALIARNIDDKETLESLADGNGLHATGEPWVQAQYRLARGVAGSILGRTDAPQVLAEARDRFASLAAPFFISLAERYSKSAAPSEPANQKQFGATTRREREIANLVAEGLTNREIAERLVLSERTVEGHIANLFAKLNVSSRTQVAAWYLRASSSVA